MWYENAFGKEKIDFMFNGQFSLAHVRLERVWLNSARDLELEFLCNDIPDTIPDKWRRQGFNAINVKLRTLDVVSLHIRGARLGFFCSPSIETCVDRSAMVVVVDGFELNCEARFLDVHEFTGYKDDR